MTQPALIKIIVNNLDLNNNEDTETLSEATVKVQDADKGGELENNIGIITV